MAWISPFCHNLSSPLVWVVDIFPYRVLGLPDRLVCMSAWLYPGTHLKVKLINRFLTFTHSGFSEPLIPNKCFGHMLFDQQCIELPTPAHL